MLDDKKAQIAFEFIFWVGVVMVIGVILLVLMGGELSDEISVRNGKWIENIALDIKSELILASEVNSGYKRQIYVPISDTYNITVVNSYLVLSTSSDQFSLRVPRVNGTIAQGNNTLRNIGGEVIITQ